VGGLRGGRQVLHVRSVNERLNMIVIFRDSREGEAGMEEAPILDSYFQIINENSFFFQRQVMILVVNNGQ
jgi:hypothetical protein